MSTKPLPGPVRTPSGAVLPFVALPPTELLTVNISDIPIVRDAFGDGVHFQPLRIDVEGGVWVVLATFSPGSAVPLHYHTGVAEVYTLSGKWYYLEYPDQPQVAGSYLFEPAGSVHTFVCPESNTEDTVLFVRVTGANVNFSDDGTYHSILDAATVEYLTGQLADAQALGAANYICGGSAMANLSTPEDR